MHLRVATKTDTLALEELIAESVWQLQAHCYSETQRQAALGTVFGVDSQLITDKTYFLIESNHQLVACGGWSYRSTLCAADAGKVGEEISVNPQTDPARIRAFFVRPEFARQGLGTRILLASEAAAQQKGFRKFELVGTLAGEPLYAKHGYTAVERYALQLSNGEELPVVRMTKSV